MAYFNNNVARHALRWVVVCAITVLAWEAVRTLPTADAQGTMLPNAGAQRNQIIQEQEKTNAQLKELNLKMDELTKLLSSGELRVRANMAPAESEK